MDLDRRRARYAADILGSTGVENPRVEAAFAAVPREEFLTPPPWRIFLPGGVIKNNTSILQSFTPTCWWCSTAPRASTTASPRCTPPGSPPSTRRRARARSISASTGYYTAILATLVGEGGRSRPTRSRRASQRLPRSTWRDLLR